MKPRSRRLFGSIAPVADWAGSIPYEVHPRADCGGSRSARVAASARLTCLLSDSRAVHAPLCEGPPNGAVTYRSWMIASGEVQAARREQTPIGSAHLALADAPPDVMAATRKTWRYEDVARPHP